MQRIRKDQAVMLTGFALVAIWLFTGYEISNPEPVIPQPDAGAVEPTPIVEEKPEPTESPEPIQLAQIDKSILPGPVAVSEPETKRAPMVPVRQRFLQQAVIKGPNEGLAGNLVEFDGSESKGDWFIWICMPPTQGFRPVILRGGQDCGVIGTKAYFSDLTPGTYQICLVAGAAEGGDVAYHTFVNKKPGPDPPPPPPTDKLWGIIIEKSEKRTAAQNLVIENSEFRAILNGGFRVIDTDNIYNPSAKSWIERTESIPWLFLSTDEGKILWKGPLPATVNEAISIATKYRKFEPKLVPIPVKKTPAPAKQQTSSVNTGGWRTVRVEPVRTYTAPVRVYNELVYESPPVIYNSDGTCTSLPCNAPTYVTPW